MVVAGSCQPINEDYGLIDIGHFSDIQDKMVAMMKKNSPQDLYLIIMVPFYLLVLAFYAENS